MSLKSRITALENEARAGCPTCFREWSEMTKARAEARREHDLCDGLTIGEHGDDHSENCSACHRPLKIPIKVLRDLQARAERGEPPPVKIVW